MGKKRKQKVRNGFKLCQQCKIEKPLSEFYPERKGFAAEQQSEVG